MNTQFLRKNVILTLMILLTLSLTVESVRAADLPSPIQDSDYLDEGQPSPAKVELGKLLFFDKILSGNKDISCGTCHNPVFGTGDGLSVAIGTGGVGAGPMRSAGTARVRVVRNSLPLYNVGAKEYTTFLVDGGFQVMADGSFRTPFRGRTLPLAIDTLLAAQALRPITVAAEMLGFGRANDISTNCVTTDVPCIWAALVARLQAIPAYEPYFMAAYPEIAGLSDITITHVGDAIAAYENIAFRSDDSAFDAYLKTGDSGVMSEQAITGMELFYGEAGCSTCHSGPLQTDHNFHAIAMPQIGAALLTSVSRRDLGRVSVTKLTADAHKFKTPSLRNVQFTGPYGHDGAYSSLVSVIRHHLDPVSGINNYDKVEAVLPPYPLVPAVEASDFAEHDNLLQRRARALTNELAPNPLTDAEVNALLAFMYALTGSTVHDVQDKIPMTVPSGLPVSD
ncbi:MAG: cytochrome-c peroxidase [Methylococcaceae bacterium]